MPDAGQIRETPRDAEGQARRLVALAQLRQYPDPVLRQQAREVERFDGDLASLVQLMTTLMREASGVGLAANQVGVLQRLLVLQPETDEPPFALVNPRLVDHSPEQETDDEGCLSLQGVLVPVERSLSVVIEAQDPDGGELRLELTGLGARVAQHELDHLDGVLILQRTDAESRRQALALLRPRVALGARR